jgi:ABC-type polysaccharide/polyol phosphate export permease
VLDPLLQMAVYVVLVAVVFQRAVPDYPLFIFAAILPWKWFTASVNDATHSVVSQERLIKQIQFPKLVLPVAATGSGVIGFTFGLIPLVLIMLIYGHRMSPYLLLIPFIAAVQFVFTMAVAILVAAANVFFRDLGNISRHFLRLWWYLSPGLYPLVFITELGVVQQYPIIGQIAALNPFAILFEAYRSVIYGTADTLPGYPNWAALGGLLVASVVLLAITTVVFKRLEPNFAKVL